MARGGEGGGNVMDMLVWVAIGVLVLAILFMLIPVIGGQFEANMPALGATSNWNASYSGKSNSNKRSFSQKVRGFLEGIQHQTHHWCDVLDRIIPVHFPRRTCGGSFHHHIYHQRKVSPNWAPFSKRMII